MSVSMSPPWTLTEGKPHDDCSAIVATNNVHVVLACCYYLLLWLILFHFFCFYTAMPSSSHAVRGQSDQTNRSPCRRTARH